MASTHKHLRSSTANKRPTTAIADGQIAFNTNASSPGLFFKDSTGASIIKIGPVHVGSTAPNATPGAGGSSGNSTGETWLDNSLTPVGVKIWNGSAWVNATPVGSTTVQGLLELATSAETQTGTDTDRAVTPAGLQSKLSDSTSTTSSTTIASSTAVKAAYDLAAAALPLSGGIITGNLEIGTTGSLSFEGSTADAFETTIAVTDPTADRTITLPDQTGNFLVSGNASIVNADVNASAAIAGTKISPDFGSQTITTTGVVSAALGAAATPSITFTGDLNTGIYSPGADQVAISTNGANRFQIDSSGNITVDTNTFYVDAANNRVGVGTTSPSNTLHVAGIARIANSAGGELLLEDSDEADGNRPFQRIVSDSGSLVFLNANRSGTGTTGSTERARIDSSGRLLLGTSSARGSLRFQVEGTDLNGSSITTTRNSNDASPSVIGLKKSRGTATGSYTIVQNNDRCGVVAFYGADGSNDIQLAGIDAFVDGTPGANDMPGRLVFSTTADGAASPTERMRITSGGSILVGTTDGASPSIAGKGFFRAYGNSDPSSFIAEGYQQTVGYINREVDDGALLEFRQASIAEGTISVSGTTVSYNGAHLSRWSQLPNGVEREEILRGTVLSNIDEMCEWGEEENEQLNRMKVSDVEGDKNVSGVFQCWDDDDDTYTNDFYCAMTGDFIIRIAGDVTVERGDLLMSAGDGTAKPQGDGYVQDKTIAKVTSTNVSCTYDDGSYCVPCVLMAC